MAPSPYSRAIIKEYDETFFLYSSGDTAIKTDALSLSAQHVTREEVSSGHSSGNRVRMQCPMCILSERQWVKQNSTGQNGLGAFQENY